MKCICGDVEKLKALFPQLFTKELKGTQIYINSRSPLLQKIAYIFLKIHYHKEMFRLRGHSWDCPKCKSRSRIIGYAVQITTFKCLKCGNEFDIEGY